MGRVPCLDITALVDGDQLLACHEGLLLSSLGSEYPHQTLQQAWGDHISSLQQILTAISIAVESCNVVFTAQELKAVSSPSTNEWQRGSLRGYSPADGC